MVFDALNPVLSVWRSRHYGQYEVAISPGQLPALDKPSPTENSEAFCDLCWEQMSFCTQQGVCWHISRTARRVALRFTPWRASAMRHNGHRIIELSVPATARSSAPDLLDLMFPRVSLWSVQETERHNSPRTRNVRLSAVHLTPEQLGSLKINGLQRWVSN